MCVRGCIFFLAHWPMYVHVYATCAPLLRHVRASTSTSMYVHVRDQNDNTTYASTRWVPTVRHFLPCEDWWAPAVKGRIIFLPVIWTHFLACKDVAGGSQQPGGNVFFAKYSGLSSGSLLSDGGITTLRVIRSQFLAAVMDPHVSFSTYCTLPMGVVP